MNWKRLNIRKIAANLLFCSLVVFLFGKNSLLRPMAVNAPYAEYISGVLVLVLFYLNRFYLYAKLFLKGKFSQFVFISLLSLVLAVGVESTLVYSSLMPDLLGYYSRNVAWLYFMFYSFLMLCRDVVFILISFALCNITRQKELNIIYEEHLKEICNEIPVNQSDEQDLVSSTEDESVLQDNRDEEHVNLESLSATEFLKIDDILYVEQCKGHTLIHTINDKLFIRTSSLRRTIELIGTDALTQVSKSAAVINNFVTSFDQNQVTLKSPCTDKVYPVTIGSSFRESSAALLKKALDDNKQKDNELHDSTVNVKEWNVPPLLKNKKFHQVYYFIQDHPDCKSFYLSEKMAIPTGSLNRILAQLKKEGLIEYVGSKKTGGYRVVETKDDSLESAETR